MRVPESFTLERAYILFSLVAHKGVCRSYF